LNYPLRAPPAEEMLYSYRVYGCKDVNVVDSTRRVGDDNSSAVGPCNVTSSLWTIHATVALRVETFTVNGPPTICSAASKNCEAANSAPAITTQTTCFLMLRATSFSTRNANVRFLCYRIAPG